MRTLGRLGGIAAIGVLAVSGVVAFATIAPRAEQRVQPPRRPIVEALEIRPDATPAPTSYFREELYQRGDTLPAFLERLGIEPPHAARLAKLRVLQQLRPGTHVSAEVSAEGELLMLSFLSGRDTVVKVVAEANGQFRVTDDRAQLYTRVAMKSGVIESSLFAAADDAGIPDSIAMQLGDVFGGDIDFHRDLRKGDQFAVVYELHYLGGRPVRAGRLLAAEFTNNRKTFRAVHFRTGYYTPEGKNLRKAFLRSPLEFSRVSSGFGMRRHPIAQAWIKHQGIDYAAPTGTRVRAIGDGVVDHAGLRGGYGKVVIIRHHGQYSTVYAHLSRINVHRGQRVAQNDTIGAVGQTGWATGPHLHYEFRVAGEARNPLSVAMPAALPVAPQDLATFRSHAEPLVTRLDLIANSALARLD
ncbi:MAG TPA: peptidoglycan DD-metalloendopeptidase family protein [Burkholderiales bacterium]|nr:peptidoglycan DD-metalloendopeptidase family protein [Burkholderiales bacterium]